MAEPLPDQAFDALFRHARTSNAWAPHPFGEADIRALYDLAKLGPTASNSTPARFVWLMSPQSRERLSPHMGEGNRVKVATASAVVIIGYDLDFPSKLPKLFPHNPAAKDRYPDMAVREVIALRNSSMQGAYLLMAARAMGWDTGPMSGFNNASLDADFFAGTPIKSNFVMALGKTSGERLFDRLPRLDFDEANTVL